MQEYTTTVLLVTLLAAAGGSFSTLLIHRLHHDLAGIWTGRSQCPACGATLGWQELIPILSYYLQGGKCNHCGARIPFTYPLIEMTWVLVGLLFVQKFYSTPEMIPLLLAAGFVLVLGWYDLLHMQVDERVVVPALVLAAGWAVLRQNPGEYAVGALVGAVFYAAQYLLSRGRWVGFGDVYLGAFMGLVLGWKFLLLALLLAYILGSVVGLFLVVFRNGGRHTKIPMGAFLMPSTLVMLYAGSQIWGWYWGLVGLT